MSEETEAYVAHGGRTVGRQMRLHTREDCAGLSNAVAIRPATDSEIESREWCEQCTGEIVNDEPDWGAYRAAVARAEEVSD
jgi:hypothetical protein